MFYSCNKSILRKDLLFRLLHFPGICMQQCYNTLPSNFHPIIRQVVAYGRLKTKENFKLLALKMVTVTYERWSLYKRFQISWFDLETFVILEIWLPWRDGGNQRFDSRNLVSLFWKKQLCLSILEWALCPKPVKWFHNFMKIKAVLTHQILNKLNVVRKCMTMK